MTRDPFLRLALLTLTVGLALALGLVGRWFGYGLVAGAILAGALVGVGLSVERSNTTAPPAERPAPRRLRTGGDR